MNKRLFVLLFCTASSSASATSGWYHRTVQGTNLERCQGTIHEVVIEGGSAGTGAFATYFLGCMAGRTAQWLLLSTMSCAGEACSEPRSRTILSDIGRLERHVTRTGQLVMPLRKFAFGMSCRLGSISAGNFRAAHVVTERIRPAWVCDTIQTFDGSRNGSTFGVQVLAPKPPASSYDYDLLSARIGSTELMLDSNLYNLTSE
jgi:hypothetical protein